MHLLYKQLFKRKGIQILDFANNGEETVSKYRNFNEKPDVILMDHRMPIKNGIEATREIIQIDKRVKVIFVSADNSMEKEALSVGAIGFIEKIFDISEFIKYIKLAIDMNT
ncbi:MAG: Chemotaxis protein CheY [Candidatus Heimdallarchaeota archaeon LC_3]|nr:MAG: Chemotaxis protein CheY [Candidatus Heimdallarchaeota archaeon LC_3]